jgi:hypothetical protein
MKIRSIAGRFLVWSGKIAVLIVLLLLITRSTVTFIDSASKVRRFTSTIEFDFISWTINALGIKLGQSSLGAVEYLDQEQRNQLVLEYFELVREQNSLEASIRQVYADPTIEDPEIELKPLLAGLAEVQEQLSQVQPLAEAVLQDDIAQVVREMGIVRMGLGHPPVAFHFSKPPMALIVSPREVIRQDANVQIEPDYPVQSQIELESQVEQALDVSSLVVPIGGIGTYPTMVMQSDAISWVMETIAHEWIHNYLTLRPLGVNYNTSPELRTINETTASLLGKAIGQEVLRQKYPQYLPSPSPSPPSPSTPLQEPPAFDFRAVMRETRQTVDAMLAEGNVEGAEQYMEKRRLLFWENGYRHIRRLNQAYFAFYGAYADQPGGAAGEDPVGDAVRTLWSKIDDPGEFLRRISWVTSFQQLLELVEEVDSI